MNEKKKKGRNRLIVIQSYSIVSHSFSVVPPYIWRYDSGGGRLKISEVQLGTIELQSIKPVLNSKFARGAEP